MIQLFQKAQEFENWRDTITSSVGLVPTMGNLHEGHLSLVKKSLLENNYTVVTIFVNPKQFSPDEDFENYPRTVEEDIQKLTKLLGSDDQEKLCVFVPLNEKEIYPGEFDKQVTVEHPMTKVLCGAYREGHFDGVTTVVYRLFEIVKPHTSYFGEKDFQQLSIIKEMVKQQKLSVKISSLPIVRDNNGLALSSRNQYLSSQEKSSALILSQTIQKLASHLSLTSIQDIIEKRDTVIQNDSNWQYLEILDSEDLSKPTKDSRSIVIAGAYILGNTRLIDNTITNFS